MALWVLLIVAALTFSLLTGALEVRSARRAQRRLLARTSPPLHPFPQHGYRSVSVPPSRRAAHLGALFAGLLAVVYVLVLLLRLLWHIVSPWVSPWF
jgi:hypothetical protein